MTCLHTTYEILKEPFPYSAIEKKFHLEASEINI